MDKVLQLLLSVMKRNGCTVIHASYTRLVFATEKIRVMPDILNFWTSLSDNIRSVKPLEPLGFSDISCLKDLHYGVIWMDPANWCGIVVDPRNGEVTWKPAGGWQLANFLPAAPRKQMLDHIVQLLIIPQQELERRYGDISSALPAGMEVEANGCEDGEDMDSQAGDCAEDEGMGCAE